jgi:hypothetical protein
MKRMILPAALLGGLGLSAQLATPIAAGNNPADLALGDFDEDSGLDVAAANHERVQLERT